MKLINYQSMIKTWSVLCCFFFAVSTSTHVRANDAAIDSTYLGEDWTLTNLNNQAVTLSDYQGQPVILVFWATWCPYCKKLLPGITLLNDKYQQQGLKVIAVNIKEDWKPHLYWRNHGYTFDAVLEGDAIAQMYGIKGTPGIVFIAPSGKVLKVTHFSDPEHPSLEKFAQHFLAQSPSKRVKNPL
ncbi:TlpA disulfide reductase family protein [Thalassotalea sp. G2M2-11]|uniref:peroxiredoxin family protein n=1 Tax=Thalassotalea sp. G2M2-11 TaxID=2787627 RepID=UPI0019D03BC2|nr:TlpA disulfide reductase family protein [Thalassotalea sp. G2M2-11]